MPSTACTVWAAECGVNTVRSSQVVGQQRVVVVAGLAAQHVRGVAAEPAVPQRLRPPRARRPGSARAVLTSTSPGRTRPRNARVDHDLLPGRVQGDHVGSGRPASVEVDALDAEPGPARRAAPTGRSPSSRRAEAADSRAATPRPIRPSPTMPTVSVPELAGPRARPSRPPRTPRSPAVTSRSAGQHQGDGVVGDGAAVGARGVGDQHAACGGGGRGRRPRRRRRSGRRSAGRGAASRWAAVTGPVPAIQAVASASSGAERVEVVVGRTGDHRAAGRLQLAGQVEVTGGERAAGHQHDGGRRRAPGER